MSETGAFPRLLEIGECCANSPKLFADATNGTLLRYIDHPYYGYAKDEVWHNWPFPQTINRYLSFGSVLKMLNGYDVAHYHYQTLLPRCVDLPIVAKTGIKVCLHYHGSDIRWKKTPIFSKYADKIFVSTPDLLQYCPSAEWAPNPVNLDLFENIGVDLNHDVLRVLHAPSNPQKKGTEIIRKALSKIDSIEYLELSGCPHHEIIDAIRFADVIIDQVRPDIGCYGTISLEAMAMGKPVICSISEVYDTVFGDCPILPLRDNNTKNIAHHILTLASDRELCEVIGANGRKYVENTHEVSAVVKRLFGDLL